MIIFESILTTFEASIVFEAVVSVTESGSSLNQSKTKFSLSKSVNCSVEFNYFQIFMLDAIWKKWIINKSDGIKAAHHIVSVKLIHKIAAQQL